MKQFKLLIPTILLMVAPVSCKVSGPEATGSVSFNPNGDTIKGTMVEQVFLNQMTQKLYLYAIWMEPNQIITINKNTVINNRVEETVKTVEELGDGNKYVMISDGPIYNSECKEVTEIISDNRYIA